MRHFPHATHLKPFVFRPAVELLEDRNAPDNLAPIAINDLFTFDEDELFDSMAPGVLANDSDPDNDPITAVLYDAPSIGQLTFHANGSFTYVPQENYHGQVTFTYKAFDGINWSDLATVTLMINAVNDAPVAGADAVSTDEDTAITFDVLANDLDVDGDSLSIDSFTQPSHGTLTLNPNQSFSYTPSAGFSGWDEFTYTINDPAGATSTATVNVTVNQVGPAFDDEVLADEDTPTTISVLANDGSDDPGSLELVAVGGPSHGTAEINQDNTVTYTPELNFFGYDSFTYTMEEVSTGDTDTATVWLMVYPVNDDPVGFDDYLTVDEDSSVTFNVLDNDIDVENPDLGALVDQPEHGTVVYELTGTVTYRPHEDYCGTDEFTYHLFDDSGGEDTATVTMTILPEDDEPIAYNDLYSFGTPPDVPPPTFTEEAPGLLRNDIDYDFYDPDYVYSLEVGTVVIPANFAGSLSVHPDGSFDYTPPMNFFGTTSFTYEATDGYWSSDPATVWLIVLPLITSPPGDPPPPVVARDDVFEYDLDITSIGGNVLVNDDNATYAIVEAPPFFGRLLPFSGDGSFVYYPDPTQDVIPVPGVNLTPTGVYVSAGGLPYTAYASDGRSAQALLKLQKDQEVRVDTIEFRQYWDETYFYLTENPSSEGATPGGGKRVFPDLIKPMDKNAEARRTVWVKVTLTGAMRRGQSPAVWAYDVDDPSSSVAPVDDEDKVDSLGRKYDNRSPFVPDAPWQQLSLWAKSDANGVVWAALPVSMKPGDNYRVVASMTTAQQTGFHAKHPDPENKGRVFDAAGNDAATHADVRVSELLTVWRRLNVEADSMGKEPAGTQFEPSDLLRGDIPDPDLRAFPGAFTPAYITIERDTKDARGRPADNSETPWHYDFPTMKSMTDYFIGENGQRGTRGQERVNYWVAYVANIYEFSPVVANFDNDPEDENAALGFTYKHEPEYSAVSREIFRDVAAQWLWNAFQQDHAIQVIPLHEVGHQFELEHTELNAQGLPVDVMWAPRSDVEPEENKTKLVPLLFSPAQLAIIRNEDSP